MIGPAQEQYLAGAGVDHDQYRLGAFIGLRHVRIIQGDRHGGIRQGIVYLVSRFFVPKWDIPEDPETGSADCTLAPYWATHLSKSGFIARQLLRCGGELRGERVIIAGNAVKFLVGEIAVPD